MDKKVEIVSLGVNCLPRTILTRGGVKPRKADGELSCPFDLVSHPFESIIYDLENDFKDYFSDLYFEVRKRNIFDFRKKGLWKKKDGTKFFHDKDCKIGDIIKLEKRIKHRIENFYSIIKSETPILFVLNIDKNAELIPELVKILEKICINKKFKIAILDFNNIVNYKHEKIEILKIPAPNDTFGTTWNMKKYRNSELGKYVEKCICQFITNIIKQDFNTEFML